jgi:hypothetical protein
VALGLASASHDWPSGPKAVAVDILTLGVGDLATVGVRLHSETSIGLEKKALRGAVQLETVGLTSSSGVQETAGNATLGAPVRVLCPPIHPDRSSALGSRVVRPWLSVLWRASKVLSGNGGGNAWRLTGRRLGSDGCPGHSVACDAMAIRTPRGTYRRKGELRRCGSDALAGERGHGDSGRRVK